MNQTTDDHPHSKIEKTTHSKIENQTTHLLSLDGLSGGNSSTKLLQRHKRHHFIKSGQSLKAQNMVDLQFKQVLEETQHWPCRWERPRQLCTGIRQTVSSFFPEQSGRRSSGPGCSSWTNLSCQIGDWWLVNVWGPVERIWGLGVFLEVDKENQFESFKVSWPSPFIGKIKNLILDKM